MKPLLNVYNQLILCDNNSMIFDPDQPGDPVLIKEYKDNKLVALIRVYDDGSQSVLKVIEGGK